MKISVIVPTFNRAALLGRALDSVVHQSCQPHELIVIDDGSSDATAELIQKSYPTANYLYQENRGVSAARNAGIKIATGEWLAFLDSDDSWVRDKLKLQGRALRESGLNVSHTNEIWIRNGVRVNQMKKHRKRGGKIYQYCLPLCAISPSSVMIRGSVFESIGLFDESLPACEDYDMWLRLCSKQEVQFLDEPLVTKYGGHSDQLSRSHWGMDRFRVYSLEKILLCNELSADDRRRTVDNLVQKLTILLKGATRNNNTALMDSCRESLSRWEPHCVR
jgi:glycosyltransferase involved in cell wall biosynthesis